MTRVVPPREAPPSEAALLRQKKPTFLRWSVFRTLVLRLGSVLLLLRGGQYWLEVFGAAGGDFVARATTDQILIGALAILTILAGVGLWFLAIWGIALWVVALTLEIGPSVAARSYPEWPALLIANPFVAASLALFGFFVLALFLSRSEGPSADTL